MKNLLTERIESIKSEKEALTNEYRKLTEALKEYELRLISLDAVEKELVDLSKKLDDESNEEPPMEVVE